MAALTAQEIRNLTLYKWRYSLESQGFSAQEVARLLFVKWAVYVGRIAG